MSKICILCGKKFEPRPHQSKRQFCYDKHFGKCEWCGKQFEITNLNYPQKTCSAECRGKLRTQNAQKTSLAKYGVKNAGYTSESQTKIKTTSLAKYGAEHYFASDIGKQRVKEGMIQKYGVDNPMKSAEIKKKSEQTCLDRYGDTCTLGANSSIREKIAATNIEKYGTQDPGNLPEFREKAKQTSIDKYGKEYYTQTDSYRSQFRQTCLERYGVDHFMHSEEVKSRIRANNLKKYGVESCMQLQETKQHLSDSCMEKYGVPWACMLPQAKANNHSLHSKVNDNFAEMLSSSGIEYEREYRLEDRLYDFKLQDENILIEIDPSPTHTSSDCGYFTPVSKDYQYAKSKLAESLGYRCIHIFDWDDPQKIIASLQPKHIIYGRDTVVRVVKRADCIRFLEKYHFQGSCNNQSKRYGLYYDDELIQIMTFGSPRYTNKYQYELLRLCTKPDTRVIGGSSKLFKRFINDCSPSSIVSYCDNSKFDGRVYSTLGFTKLRDGEPSRVWSKGSRHITDNLLRQRGYDQLFGTNFGKGTSNEQLMLQHNWLPVYNCGQSTYIWRSEYETNI